MVEEHGGFKVGDKVRLLGVQVPDVAGKITRIYQDTLMGLGREEMAFEVIIKNPHDGNVKSRWFPIYLDGLEKVS